MRRWTPILLSIAACRLLFSVDELSGASSPDDSSTPLGSSPDGSGGLDAADSIEAGAASCESGAVVVPVEVTGETFDGGLAPSTCFHGAAIARDDAGAQIAHGGEVTRGGERVTGCVRARFAAPVALDSVSVTMFSSNKACAASCTNCNEGRAAFVALPLADGGYSLQYVTLRDVIDEYTVPASASPIDHVLVCRTPWGPASRNVTIDAIRATCR